MSTPIANTQQVQAQIHYTGQTREYGNQSVHLSSIGIPQGILHNMNPNVPQQVIETNCAQHYTPVISEHPDSSPVTLGNPCTTNGVDQRAAQYRLDYPLPQHRR